MVGEGNAFTHHSFSSPSQTGGLWVKKQYPVAFCLETPCSQRGTI